MNRWFGSDLLVDRLAGLGVRYLALNPGASIRGLHDCSSTRRVARRSSS